SRWEARHERCHGRTAGPRGCERPRPLVQRGRGRKSPTETAPPGHHRPRQDRSLLSGRRVRRGLGRLQPCRWAARRRPARRRVHRLPVAPLEVPSRDRRGRAGLRGRLRAPLRPEGRGRPRLDRSPTGDAPASPAARAAPARAAGRPRGRTGPPARHLDHGDGQRLPALLDVRRFARDRARASRVPGGRDAADPPARARVPPLRGLLLEELPRLHLALLDHPDGPLRSARPGLRGAHPLGGRDPRRDADPLGLGELALLQDGRADELRPEPGHAQQPGAPAQQGRGVHHHRRAGQHPVGGRPDARLLRRDRLRLPAVSLHRALARVDRGGHGTKRRLRPGQHGPPRRRPRARRPDGGDGFRAPRPRDRGAARRARGPEGVPARDARIAGGPGGGGRKGGQLVNDDLEHLRWLAIFYYVVAGITALLACLALIQLFFGLAFWNGWWDRTTPDVGATIAGAVLVTIASVFLLFGWTLVALLLLAGQSLAKHRRYTFCFVVGAVACMIMPVGTILGVFTLIVLLRPS